MLQETTEKMAGSRCRLKTYRERLNAPRPSVSEMPNVLHEDVSGDGENDLYDGDGETLPYLEALDEL